MKKVLAVFAKTYWAVVWPITLAMIVGAVLYSGWTGVAISAGIFVGGFIIGLIGTAAWYRGMEVVKEPAEEIKVIVARFGVEDAE